MKTRPAKLKLERYAEAIDRWHRAQLNRDPLADKPTREQHGLTSPQEIWAATQIEREKLFQP